VWAVLLVAMAGYVLALARLGPSRVTPGEPVATRRQLAAFFCGVGLLWLASDWPVHDLAERYLYSVHMVQHELLALPAPPLILVGMPDWMLRTLLRWAPLRAVARVTARPIVAGAVFNTVVVVSHIPAVVDYTLDHHAVHFFAHVVLFSAALIMWWPVVNRLPEYRRMSYPAKLLYLFLMTVVPDAPILFLALSTGPVYHFYRTAPRPFALSALGDQQLAAGIMNMANIVFFGCMGAAMFFRWWGQEEAHARRGAPASTLTWDDVRAELERTSPSTLGTKRSS
jgi:putative membrane protein